MRKWLLCLLALAAVTIAAKAQSPGRGLKSGYISLLYTGEVLPGQMDNFKQVAGRVIADAAQEPGTLIYEWCFRPDQKTFDVIELFQNSDALVAHDTRHRRFSSDLGKVQKTVSMVVFGSLNEEAKRALAYLNPVYETPMDGFVR